MLEVDTPEPEETSLPEAEVEQSTDATQEATPAPVSDIIDLDSVEKFKFQGREWTPKDMQRAHMMQSDYTRKTQEISKERQYWDNLEHDLARIKTEPQLIGQFMQIYPQKFHRFLDFVGATPSNPGTKQIDAPQGVDPSFYREFQELKADMHERKVQAIESELDNKFGVLQKKYPFADEEVILARAESLLSKGTELNDKVWNDLWKSNNDKMERVYKEHYSKQVASQKNANKKSADIAPGGGIPGSKPRTPKNIKEASRFALEELEST